MQLGSPAPRRLGVQAVGHEGCFYCISLCHARMVVWDRMGFNTTCIENRIHSTCKVLMSIVQPLGDSNIPQIPVPGPFVGHFGLGILLCKTRTYIILP